MTGSLVSVAVYLCMAEFGTILDCLARAIRGTQSSLEMATGNGQLLAGRSGVDFTVQLDVPWNAPEVFVNMEFAGLHELDIESMPDMLDLRARQPRAAVILVLWQFIGGQGRLLYHCPLC